MFAMFSLVGWLIYGLIVGYLARILHPGEDKINFLQTIVLGCAGSFVGGGINWLLGFGHSPFSPSGILMGVVGGVILCWGYSRYRISQFVKEQGRKPLW